MMVPKLAQIRIPGIYQERRKLQTLGEEEETARGKIAPISGHQDKRSMGSN
jgi:hypothetical protein